jgi:hypothetical protein
MSETTAPAVDAAAEPETRPAILVDAGKRRKKAIKLLKRGEGPLIAEIDSILDEVRRELGPAGEGREILPVVLLYRERPRRRLF